MAKERVQDKETEGVIAQVEFEGDSFTRLPDPNLHSGRQTRKVRVVSGLDLRTGENVFFTASEVPIEPSLLPHVPLKKAGQLHDIAEVEGASLATVRSHGASTAGVDLNKIYESRGGDPTFRPRKTTGFFIKTTARDLAKEARRKRRQTQGG